MEIYLLVIVTDFIKLLSAQYNESRSKHCNHKMNRIYVLLPRWFLVFKYLRDKDSKFAMCMLLLARHVVLTVEANN